MLRMSSSQTDILVEKETAYENLDLLWNHPLSFLPDNSGFAEFGQSYSFPSVAKPGCHNTCTCWYAESVRRDLCQMDVFSSRPDTSNSFSSFDEVSFFSFPQFYVSKNVLSNSLFPFFPPCVLNTVHFWISKMTTVIKYLRNLYLRY